MDRKEDRKHPDKKDRPIAAGRIEKKTALFFMLYLLTLGLGIGYTLSLEVVGLLGLYFLMNVLYSVKIKHIPLLDISVIATGFVLRLLVGSVATDVFLSHWIVVITFLLALFLALAKRRDEVRIFLKTEKKTRKVIDGYNLKFLQTAMVMSATIVLMAYILWSISPQVTDKLNSKNIYLSSFFVLLGIMRYLQLTIVKEKSGNPSKILLRDQFIQLLILGWVGCLVWLLYV